MAELTFGEAVRDGLAEAMREDPNVWVLGEDLTFAHTAGGNMSYAGLVDEFGPKRVVNTPISESTIMGAAVGAAVAGTRPVAELRHVDFGLCAMDELVNQASKIRYMFGGQARVPLVVRQAIGTRRGAAAQHCLSNEAWFVHIPGLVVVAPATPADGKGLLKSAIRCDDPVVFLEHKELFLSKGEVPDGGAAISLGKARLVRAGRDLTIVAWSKMALIAEAAANSLAQEGIEAEVIDLRTLWPWDRDMVYASVRKTGRLLVPQEAVKVGGFAAEVAVDVIEVLGDALKVPPRRLGAPRIPVPYSPPLEDEYRITDRHVADAARALVASKR
jgi:pyruvate dehydrogenase E1 component beta subunit